MELSIFSLRKFYHDCKGEDISFHLLVEYFGVQVWDYDILFGNEIEEEVIEEDITVIGALNIDHLAKQTILRALEEAKYVQKDAAKKLGISPRRLNYRVKQFGITCPNWKKNI